MRTAEVFQRVSPGHLPDFVAVHPPAQIVSADFGHHEAAPAPRVVGGNEAGCMALFWLSDAQLKRCC